MKSFPLFLLAAVLSASAIAKANTPIPTIGADSANHPTTLLLIDSLKMPSNFDVSVINPQKIDSFLLIKPDSERGRELIKKYGPEAANGITLIKTTYYRYENTAAPGDENYVYSQSDTLPQFPGGENSLFKYLCSTIHYPVIAAENGIQGRVVVFFIVDKNGKITNPKVVKSVDPALDKEALRVVQAMPDWTPGQIRGKKVNVYCNLPVNFRLSGEWLSEDALIVLDGQILPQKFPLHLIDPRKIESQKLNNPETGNIKKSLEKRYGKEAAKNGVIEIGIKSR